MKEETQQSNGVGKFFAYASLAAIALSVLAFLGLHSLNFFFYTFPGDQQLYAYLGFGLTGGAFVGYILIFKYIADSDLKKFVGITMIILCLIGELATAGFGMQLESYAKAGLAFTAEDIDMMIWAIRLLGVVHGIALVLEFVGDQMITAFTGIPILNTVFDRRAEARKFPADVPAVPSPTNQLDEAIGMIDDLNKRIAPVSKKAQAILDKEAGSTPSPFLKSNPE